MPDAPLSSRLILAFCRLGPAGLAPKAPGTVASLFAIAIAPFVFIPLNLPLKIIILMLLFIVGGLAASRAEKILGKSDPGSVVIDELLGQWLAVLPFAALRLWELALAFALFRFFDILKPWPVKASEKWLPGGFGIMLDDFFAGLYALAVLFMVKSFVG